jgi:hypothetical protein
MSDSIDPIIELVIGPLKITCRVAAVQGHSIAMAALQMGFDELDGSIKRSRILHLWPIEQKHRPLICRWQMQSRE